MAQVSPFRTPEELKNPEYNYFIAFKIDLSETDKGKIDAKIKTVTGSPKGDILTRRLIELKTDAIEIMCNDSVYDASLGRYLPAHGGRAKEAAAAKDYKLKEAVGVIEILCQTRKTLLKSEIIDICNTANKPVTYFTEAELFKAISYLTGMGVKIIDNIDSSIPFSDYQQTEKRLDTLGKKDLYDFLGVPQTSSETEIEEASGRMYSESNKTNDLKRKQAISQLCATAKKLLQDSKQARKTYDQYLILRNDVWSDFEKRKSFGIKEMTMDEYKNYTSTVIDLLKVGLDEAEKILAIGCKFFQITIVGKSDGNNFDFCPYPDCGKLYIKGAKSCPHCGRPLEIICWNCKQKTPFTKEDKGCPTCGATYHAHDMLTQRSEKLDQLLSRPAVEIGDLQSALMGIKNLVPDYKKVPTSVLATKVAEYEEEIRKRDEIERTKGVQYRAEMKKASELAALKNYMQAKSVAESVRRTYSDYNLAETQKTIAEYDAVIAKAQREFAATHNLIAQNNTEAAVDVAIRALGIVADLSEAKQFIAKYPPKPPLSVRATYDRGTVKVVWQLPATHNSTSYSLLRKVGSAPTGPDDGTVVAGGLTIDFFEDKNVASATRYFYAVFAERAGVRSGVVACPTPVVYFGDVANVRQEMVEGVISVKWDAPENVKTVEVWKKKGSVPPQNAGDGEKLQDVAQDGFNDGNTSGETSYLILCKYEVNGAAQTSKGVSRTFKAIRMLRLPEKLSVRQETPCEFIFEGNTDAGNLRLLFASEKLSCRTGVMLKSESYTEAVKGSSELRAVFAGQEISFTLPPDTVGWLYPVFYNDQLFIVAPPIAVNSICGLRNLAYEDKGTGGVITGVLHPKVINVIAKLSERGYVTDFSGAGDTVKLSAQDFVNQGGLKLSLKRNVEYYITVFTEADVNGKKTVTMAQKLEEVVCQRDKTAVKFCFECTPTPMKPFKLTLKFSADTEVALPELVIVRGAPKPINKAAGELVERLPAATLKKGFLSKEYTYKTTVTVPPMARGMSFSLFPAGNSAGYIQLKEVLKL